MSPKPDVSAERIPHILNAAIKIFSKKGFNATRMEDIAKEARLSIGGVYWYYKSKVEIILAIMERLIDSDVNDLRGLLAMKGTVRARMDSYIKLSLGTAKEYLPITYELYALALRNTRVRAHIRAFLHAYRDVLAQFIQQGIERGEFKAINPTEAALTFAALYEGTLELTMLDPQNVEPQNALLASMNLLMNGLQNKEKS